MSINGSRSTNQRLLGFTVRMAYFWLRWPDFLFKMPSGVVVDVPALFGKWKRWRRGVPSDTGATQYGAPPRVDFGPPPSMFAVFQWPLMVHNSSLAALLAFAVLLLLHLAFSGFGSPSLSTLTLGWSKEVRWTRLGAGPRN